MRAQSEKQYRKDTPGHLLPTPTVEHSPPRDTEVQLRFGLGHLRQWMSVSQDKDDSQNEELGPRRTAPYRRCLPGWGTSGLYDNVLDSLPELSEKVLHCHKFFVFALKNVFTATLKMSNFEGTYTKLKMKALGRSKKHGRMLPLEHIHGAQT